MTNANSSMQASSARRASSVITPALNFLGQSASRIAAAAAGSTTSSSSANMSYPRDAPPVRVKTLRHRPPDYLAESPVGAPFEAEQARDPTAAPERRLPFFVTLPASAFSTTGGGKQHAGTAKASSRMTSDADGHTEKKLPKLVNLPTQWNSKDKSPSLELSAANLRVMYTGPGQTDAHAAAVRTNYPIPSQCGMFYYEVTIVSKGRDRYIGVGVCAQNVPLNRLPGWEDHSWGYHGDDGHSFCCSGTGKAYGPIFTTGDIIGCIINFMNNTVSFTKNGVWLGVAFKNVMDGSKGEGGLYPSVGLRTPGEIVEANFGQRKFKFDIEHHYKEEKAKLLQSINASPVPAVRETGCVGPEKAVPQGSSVDRTDSSSGINQLILSYLVHHGFCETAATFYENTVCARANVSARSSTDKDPSTGDPELFNDQDIRQRQMIREHVLNGNMNEAIRLIKSLYPSILPHNRHLDLQLRCQTFIELMREIASKYGSKARHGHDQDAMQVDDAEGASSTAPALQDMVREALEYGQDMQREFGQDESEEVWLALMETYSLVAYSDPENSPVAYLLDPANRVLVADAVNSAILVSQNRPAIPAIENVYRQTSAVIQELIHSGNGAAAFVNVERECLL